MSDTIRNEIDKIVDKPRSEYGRLCICDVDCEQHLDIERYFTMRKIGDYLQYKFSIEEVSVPTHYSYENLLNDIICDIDEILITNCEEVISDNKEHEYESEMN